MPVSVLRFVYATLAEIEISAGQALVSLLRERRVAEIAIEWPRLLHVGANLLLPPGSIFRIFGLGTVPV